MIYVPSDFVNSLYRNFLQYKSMDLGLKWHPDYGDLYAYLLHM